jgi:hypothetical protein
MKAPIKGKHLLLVSEFIMGGITLEEVLWAVKQLNQVVIYLLEGGSCYASRNAYYFFIGTSYYFHML